MSLEFVISRYADEINPIAIEYLKNKLANLRTKVTIIQASIFGNQYFIKYINKGQVRYCNDFIN
jgi:hypothetical protein